MRIALFSGNYNYMREGANQALNRLASYAEDQGHQVRVYSPVTDTPAFEPAGELVAVPSITFPVRREFQLALGLPNRIRDDLRRFAPDLIHVSTPDILGTRAQTFAKRLGVPIVASLHTRFESYFGFYRLGWATPLAEAHLRRFYRRSDHVLAPTPGLVEELKRLRGDDRVSLWSRGVDRDLFDPRRRDLNWRRAQGWSDEDVVVLFFGRLVVEKGIGNFVATILRLRERGIAVKPLIVGAGPSGEAFRPLGDAVFTGHLEGEELARAIASADILLHPSRTEAFGNVVLEAMAAGLPVVCATADSARALVDHGRTGFLCPPGDVDAFAHIVGKLAEDAGRRREVGRAAQMASSRFTWEEASESVLEAYRSLGSGGGRDRGGWR
jgi:glycosyltransferase involved in cell wall biosynthesis